ncbi:hypothetical protein PILCRDRAFT_470574 [Piloderma croceum F 1598]|uniref:DUF6533 domain-containing protein n=1 Tax=Piloderma croceum (strain F 1598) TaxID=765440 RepID=A0A0C3FR64_PILCF|nr:hypothetical protein PILCRDRAFT_470574 [Piloderma croceum F 1598]
MHVPTPSDYIPFDAITDHNLRTTRLGIYIYLALAAVILYDHAITFDIEVQRIWSLNWRLPKILFLMNRYVVPLLIVMRGIADATYPLLFSVSSYPLRTLYISLTMVVSPVVRFPRYNPITSGLIILSCDFLMHFEDWIVILALGIADLILVIRVSALYGHSKIMRHFLVFFFACQMVTVIVITSILTKQTTPILLYQFVPGCYATVPDYFYSFYIPFLIFDGPLNRVCQRAQNSDILRKVSS